jgi:hypothetical protein
MRRCALHNIIVPDDGYAANAASTSQRHNARSRLFSFDALLWNTTVQQKAVQRSIYFIDALTDAKIIRAANLVTQATQSCAQARHLLMLWLGSRLDTFAPTQKRGKIVNFAFCPGAAPNSCPWPFLQHSLRLQRPQTFSSDIQPDNELHQVHLHHLPHAVCVRS